MLNPIRVSMKQIILLFLAVFFAANAFAAAPTALVISPNAYTVLNGSISIDFNAQDADANALTASLYYSDTNTGTTYTIASGIDINSTLGINLTCPGFVVSSTEYRCSYPSWNTMSVADGNWFIVLQVSDGESTTVDASDSKVMVDNSNPGIALQSPANNAYTNSSSISISFNLTDTGTGLDVNSLDANIYLGSELNRRLNDGNFSKQSITNGYTYTNALGPFSDGNITMKLKVLDLNNHSLSSQWSFFKDTTAPTAPASLTATRASGAARIDLNWTAASDVSGSGVDHYDVYRATSTISSISGLSKLNASNISGTSYSDSAGTQGTNYHYVVVAIDKASNTSGISNDVNATVALVLGGTASITIVDFIGYTNKTTPNLSLSTSNATQMQFSCNNSSWTSSVSYATSYNSFNITSGNGCTAGNGSKTVYVKFSDGTNNVTANDSTIYDGTLPATPGNLIAIRLSSTQILLSFDASTDSDSGINTYAVYRSKSAGQETFLKYIADENGGKAGIQWTDVLTEQGTYYYQASSWDKAGNESSKSNESSASTTLSFDISLTIEPSRKSDENKLYARDGNLTYRIIGTADFKQKPVIEQTNPAGVIESIETTGSGRNYSASINVLKGASGKRIVKVSGVSVDDLNDTATLEYFIDTIAPEISFIVPENNEIDGNVKLKIKGSEDSAMAWIFYRKADENAFILLGEAVKDKNFFVIDFNTADLNEGTYKLKAVIEDFAGNENELIKEVYLIPFDENRHATKTELDDALTQRIIAEDIARTFEEQLIILNEDARQALLNGKQLLNEAEKLFNERDYNAAKQKAVEAIALLEEAGEKAGRVTVEDIKSFEFDETQFNEALNKLGLSEKAKQDITNLKAVSSAVRKIKVLKSADANGSEKYQLNYVVSFKNSGTAELKNIKLIEVIPKEVAASAGELLFYGDYNVLRDDPVIVWSIASIQAGEEISLNYTYRKDLSKEEIDALLAKEPLKNYSIAPIAALAETDLSALKGGIDFSLLAMAGVAVIILAGIGFGLFYFMPKMKEKKEKEELIEEKVKKAESKKPKFASKKK